MRDALADIHLVTAGFFALAVVRFFDCQTIGLQYDTLSEAIDTHHLYETYVNNVSHVEYEWQENGDVIEVPAPIKTESELLQECLEEFVFSSLEEALAFLSKHITTTVGDPVKLQSNEDKSVFLYPENNIIESSSDEQDKD